MSVPTHNLYDFVHQLLENRFLLTYFYPYGEKDLSKTVCNTLESIKDIYSLENTPNFTNIPESIRIKDKDNIARKIFPDHLIDVVIYRKYNQQLFCYDQEPLNYDLYNKIDSYEDIGAPFLTDIEINKSQNLRRIYPDSLQKKWILLHSELNSKEVEKYEKCGDFICAYWWSHAILSRDWYRFAEYDRSLNPASDICKLFLIYCRATDGTRLYRKKFLNMIKSNNIYDYQLGSFNIKKLDSTNSATYDSLDMNHTGISIVLETVFDHRIHLTEKTLRPLACGHPFILMAGPKSLEYLKSYGFRTFNNFIDESYDNILDNDARMSMVVHEMQRLQLLSVSTKNKILKECAKIAEHNKKIFFSKKFYKQVTQELIDNVNYAKEKLVFNIDWQKLQHHRKSKINQNPAFYDDFACTPYVNAFLIHCKNGGTLDDYVPPDLD